MEQCNRRLEVEKVEQWMIKASKTERGFATDTELNQQLKDPGAGRNPRDNKRHRLEIIQEASQHMRDTLGVDIVADEEMHPVRYYLRNVPESELSEGVRAMVKERHDAKVGCWR